VKNIISLLIISVTILGFIIYLVMSQMGKDDTVLKSFQLPQKVLASNPDSSQSEWAFPLHPELSDYAVIGKNNIFRPLGWTREIQSLEEPTPTVTPEPIVQTPPPPPTYTLVLTGIAKSGSDWIAIVEDWKQKEGVFLRRGETLKDGRIQDIRSEHITLARDEMTLQLDLGESIEYGVDGRLRFDTAGTAKISKLPNETETLSGTGTDSDDGGEQSLIERMRARRQRELNQ
jgi:hypothetical protein